MPQDIDVCQYMSMPKPVLGAEFGLSQPTISHHLKVLHEAGLLDRDKRGTWVYYRARPDALASLGVLIGSPPKS